MSRFQLASPSHSGTSPPSTRASASPELISTPELYDYAPAGSDDDDLDTLPYPTELSRADFLKPEFDASTYLSSLRNRHQTLEDLRTDLRGRSQLLGRELLDLVNGHYEAFLSLGADLRGGEERVEGVRVGVLGFEREVSAIAAAVAEREREVRELLGERKKIREEVVVGRALLEIVERVAELELGLGLTRRGDGGDEDDSEDDDEDVEDEDDSDDGMSVQMPTRAHVSKLSRHTQQYILIARMADRMGMDHPFIHGLQPRLDEIRKTLLLDLASALRQAKANRTTDALLKIVRLYGDLGAQGDSIRVLKGS